MKCLVFLVLICENVSSFPFLFDKSKQDFKESREALMVVKTYLNETVTTLETNVQKTLATLENHIKNVDEKIETLDNELQMLEKDFMGKLLFYE